MSRILHLYNIFGAATERTWLDYPLGLHDRGWQVTCGYETLAPEAPAVSVPLVQLQRIAVSPTQDVDVEMRNVAACADDAELQRLLDSDFSIVHGHFGPRMLQAAPFLGRGIPTIISLYGYDASRLLRDAAWAERYRWAARRGAIFVCLCESMRQRVIDLGIDENQVRVVRLGIYPRQWKFEATAAPATPRFVFVGRYTHKKAPGDLIEAVRILGNEFGIKATLDLYGSGPLEDELRQSIMEKHLDDRVTLGGLVPREELTGKLRGATAMVLPSVEAADGDSEGTPVVLMEAQALGLPCITTKHAGNPEVLPPEGQRFVVPEHQPQQIAEAMRAMIELSVADRRALQQAGRVWMENRYSLEQTISGYDDLYEELCTFKPAKRLTPSREVRRPAA